MAGDTVKAIASFTADAVTHNGKIQHICIDIQDELKQSEISVSHDDNEIMEKKIMMITDSDKDKTKTKTTDTTKQETITMISMA